VRLVVSVLGVGLAVRTEVDVVAHSTLVPGTVDVRRVALSSRAERSITADAHVDSLSGRTRSPHARPKRLIDGREAVVRMRCFSVGNAFAAVVPVRAVETLVAHTSDELQARSAGVRSARHQETLTLSQPSQMAWCTRLRPGASLAVM
jgi:hypothetical protein